MNKPSRGRSIALVLALSGAAGCAVESSNPSNKEDLESSAQDLVGGRAGAVYTLSNDAVSNEVIVLRRAPNGSLQRAASYATGGKGSGDGLGSQGAIVLSRDHRWLYAVNAGSNELSLFAVRGEQLFLVDCVATGGVRPISVTALGAVAYVLHAGDEATAGGIQGFRQHFNGKLTSLAGSAQPLSAAAVGPAQISFSPSGRALVVTEKATNKIDEYRVDASGRAGAPVVHASVGMTPFGFAITGHGQVIVSEAFGGAADSSAVSSYQLDGRRGLSTVSASVKNTESAACWVVLAKNDRFAYVSNTASGTVSSYRVANDGSVSLVDADGRAGVTGEGSKPTDMTMSKNDAFLYALDSGTAMISGFRVAHDGALSEAGSIGGLPATAVGLAAE